MTAKQLTDSILQLAIQGKLVPQDPNDEPAPALLEKIRREKRRLVQEGVLKKKDLEEIPIKEDEITFEIPESWIWVRINDLGEVITGGTPSKQHQEYYGDEYPFYKPGDLDKGVDITSSVDGLSKKGYDASRKLKANSILVTCIGTIGKTGIISKEGACNQQINAIVPVNSLCPRYIYYTVCAPSFQSIIKKDAGQTTLPIMNKNNFCKLLFPLPPLAEQQRIVERIEEILPFVKEYGEAYEEASKMDAELPDKLKKSILQEAIMGKLGTQNSDDEPASVLMDKIREEKKRLVKEGVLKKKDLEETPVEEEEEPFKIPESWEWERLNNFFTITSGLSYKKDDLAIQSDEMVRVLRGGNISFGDWEIKPDDVFISRQFVDKSLLLRENTFITPAVSSLEHMGKTALIRTNQSNVVVGGFILMLSPIYPQPVLQEYFNILFQSYYYRKLCQTLTNKSGQAFYNLSRTKLLNAIIPLPPLAEQLRIVKRVRELFDEIDNMTINKNNNETDIEETEE